jgi:acetyl/propionyl-CoA carboxylase alpha subunit
MGNDALILRGQDGAEHEVVVGADGSVSVGGRIVPVQPLRPGELRAGDRVAWTAGDARTRWVFLHGQVYVFEVGARPGSGRGHTPKGHPGSLSAPMPATVIKTLAAPGDRVRAGDVLVLLEAMKMELPVRAAADGVVRTVRCRVGELVQPGQDLIEMAPEDA